MDVLWLNDIAIGFIGEIQFEFGFLRQGGVYCGRPFYLLYGSNWGQVYRERSTSWSCSDETGRGGCRVVS